jgi:hypothetical protein
LNAQQVNTNTTLLLEKLYLKMEIYIVDDDEAQTLLKLGVLYVGYILVLDTDITQILIITPNYIIFSN